MIAADGYGYTIEGRTTYRFTTDGCSGRFMCMLRLVWRVRYALGLCDDPIPPWEPDCVEHDKKYFCGGTAQERVIADGELAAAVAGHGFPRLSRVMIIGVGVGGVPWLPTRYRWGYGWKFPYRYRK